MSTHCGRYPGCGCPEKIGMECHLSDEELESKNLKYTNILREEITAKNLRGKKLIIAGEHYIGSTVLHAILAEFPDTVILREDPAEAFQRFLDEEKRPVHVPIVPRVNPVMFDEPFLKDMSKGKIPKHSNGKKAVVSKTRERNRKARKQRKQNRRK